MGTQFGGDTQRVPLSIGTLSLSQKKSKLVNHALTVHGWRRGPPQEMKILQFVIRCCDKIGKSGHLVSAKNKSKSDAKFNTNLIGSVHNENAV